MVSVRAQVDGSARLFDGMNVRVNVKRSVADQFVIPKTAVVLRSGKQVVFTLQDGKAMWNYVQTGLENLSEYTVTGEGMEEGVTVITAGNVNLAEDLREINADCWLEKKHSARRMTESIQNKLFIPTMLMFVGILIVIVVPAMAGFNL